jgi:TolB protein
VIRACVAAAFLALLVTSSAHATFPGGNGKIAFSDKRDDPNPTGCDPNCNFEIYSINPNGTGLVRLTNDPGVDVRPAWSPNGQRIVFNRYAPGADIVVMNADGSGQTSLGPGYDPSWSFDGQKIVFVAIGECGSGTGGVWTMNPDGTGRSFVACSSPDVGEDGEGDPVWSPDGGLIAFTADLAEFDILTVRPDGTNLTNLTTSPNDIDRDPNWSPNFGAKIAWGRDPFSGEAIWTMNRDGTGQAQLIASGSDPAWSPQGTQIVVDGLTLYNADGTGGTFLTSGVEPDWQPITTGYARPKGAQDMYISLVPAYEPCASPDRQHGPPLGFPSCTPSQTSPNLTVGSPDANGAPANSIGAIQFRVAVGAPGPPDDSDVKLNLVRVTDVRCAAALPACGSANSAGGPDYTGELEGRLVARLTDKSSSLAGSEGTTTTDFEFPISGSASPFRIPCAATASTSVGATCNTSTTFQAMVPGSVHDTRRAIWQLDQVRVFDGGADGAASTQGDNSLFAVQGVFVP